MSGYSAFYADPVQFSDSDAVRKAAQGNDMGDGENGDILIAEMTTGITFFDPIKAVDLSNPEIVSALEDRFNDQENFNIRVCALTGVTLPYFSRMSAPLRDQQISGLAVIEGISTSPGFDPMDILHAGLQQISALTAASGDGILWMLTVRDLATSQSQLHAAMSDQFSFMKRYPCWSTTTFPKIGPISGTMAGLVPGRSRWSGTDDWCSIGCEYEIEDEAEHEGLDSGDEN
jgi:hypothetical protein